MRDPYKPIPRLREGDKVLVRRVNEWVTAEVVSCANGLVWVKWGSRSRWSWRPSRQVSMPWTCAVPCDADYLRRDLSDLPLSGVQRRALERRQYKAKKAEDLNKETRRQQQQFAKQNRIECDEGQDEEQHTQDDNNPYYYDRYSRRNNYDMYASTNRKFYGAHSLKKESKAHTTGKPTTKEKYAYALYKGKRYSMDEINRVLANDRQRAKKEEPLRDYIRAVREELFAHNVNDPSEVQEAFYLSDISECGDDLAAEHQWGAEDDIAEGWDSGAPASSFQGRSVGAPRPRRQRDHGSQLPRSVEVIEEPAWVNSVAENAGHHNDDNDDKGASVVWELQEDNNHHAPSGPASDWANPYDLPSFGDSTPSLSDFGSSWTTTAVDYSFTPASQTSFDLRELAQPTSFYDASQSFVLNNDLGHGHTFSDNYCAPTYSDSISTAAADNTNYFSSSSHTTYNDSDDHHNHNANTASPYGSESGEDNDDAEEEEDDQSSEGLGGLFSESQARRESRSSKAAASLSTDPKPSGPPRARKAQPPKPGPDKPATAVSAQHPNGDGKAVVLDVRQMKRRQKWEARQAKRDEFKRRQRELTRTQHSATA